MDTNITCGSDEYFRYVKIQKFEGITFTHGYQYSEFEVYAYPENVIMPQNIALNKAVTAGVWDANLPKSNINDGNNETFVWPSVDSEEEPREIFTDNADGVASDVKDAWYIIDLEDRYKIEYVKIFDSTETWTSPYNLKVVASNDPTFTNGVHEIVNSGTDGYVAMGSPLGETTDEYYRYVKLQKFPGSTDESTWGYQYSEFEIYAYPENVKEDKEIEIGTITVNKNVSLKFILNVPYTTYEIAKETELQVYTAVYNAEGILIDIIPITKTVASNESSSIGGALPVPAEAASYRVFVWKNMIPLIGASDF